jgi:hypothetical protein
MPGDRLPLPAYGRELLDARRRGLRPTDPTMIYLDRWPTRPGPYVVPTLCVPRDVPFTSLDWSIVRKLDVHLLSWERRSIKAALDTLRRAGVATITVHDFSATDDQPWAIDIDNSTPLEAALAKLRSCA